MLRQYFKQAWQLLKASPLVSAISIVGTALSIAMIMIEILVIQINVAGFSPETHRNRMIFLDAIRVEGASGRSAGGFSAEFARECLYELESSEAATAWFSLTKAVSIPGKKRYKENTVKYTDAGFWNVYDFQFLAGRPFSEADFTSAICNAVVTEQLARELYGRTDIIGETIVFDFINFTVTGVVKDVSEAAIRAYGEVWVPYTTNGQLMATNVGEGMMGAFKATVLAKNKSHLQEVKDEMNRLVDKYNTTKIDHKAIPLNTFTAVEYLMGAQGWRDKASPKDFILRTGGLLLFLLLVPALNLTGVAQTTIQQRQEEIGIRKSFGATGSNILRQLIGENLLISLLGGIIGIVLSLILLSWTKSFLFENDPMLTGEMILQPVFFISAFIFIILLNVLSIVIPAIRVSGLPIVNVLKGSNNKK